MHAEKSNFSIARMARLLEVSRSGFYAWLTRGPSARALRAERIDAKIAWFHGESDEVSGSPRIVVDLREDGEVISRKTVATAMRRLGLRGICPTRWRTTTITDTQDSYPPDAVTRVWDTGMVNRVWVGDITYLRTWEGWLYLATVIDAHSRRVIGWAIAENMRTDLVEQALQMAITCAASCPPTSSSTPTAAPSTHQPRSPPSPPPTASPAPWDAPGCAGTTPWPSRSSPP